MQASAAASPTLATATKPRPSCLHVLGGRRCVKLTVSSSVTLTTTPGAARFWNAASADVTFRDTRAALVPSATKLLTATTDTVCGVV